MQNGLQRTNHLPPYDWVHRCLSLALKQGLAENFFVGTNDLYAHVTLPVTYVAGTKKSVGTNNFDAHSILFATNVAGSNDFDALTFVVGSFDPFAHATYGFEKAKCVDAVNNFAF